MSRKLFENYMVNFFTMYIRPYEFGDKLYSLVGETDGEYLSTVNPLMNIKNACTFYGGNLESRRKGTKLLINYSRKLPIIIEPVSGIYAFCTTSHDNPKGIWFFYEHIKDYEPVSGRETLVIFHNGQSIIFPVSFTSFKSLMLRTSYLQRVYMQRVNYSKKQSFYLLNRPNTTKASESSEFYLKNPK
ncbi:competence protein ComK [Neobacillus jeddahensis]|uniref:competence protein ComK n=1 Tax=Neobacillus jeddahensis TaxID=1461580 RepID=UPI00058EE68B|nr:competence protein ComK [Neobacillus jeddahensis]